MNDSRAGETSGTRTFSGRYVTLVRLGESETVTTYLARDATEGRTVVVRVPAAALLAEPSFPFLLERNALELLRVRHPHVARVIDAGRHEGTPYYVTEYVEGESLALRLSGGRTRQSPVEIYRWLLDVAEALDFVHAKESTHREVRPSHLLLSRDGRAMITDFVVAGAMDGLEDGVLRTLPSPVRPGVTAPEVEAGLRPSPASDQYSLAATVVLALVGSTPPRTPDALRAALLEHVTAECAEDVLRALAPDPAERFASCYEFARAFGLERKRLARRTHTVVAPPLDLPGGSHSPVLVPATIGGPRPSLPDAHGADDGRAPPLPAADAPAVPSPFDFPVSAREPAHASIGEGAWLLRVGLADEYARDARDGDFVAIDWSELGNLGWLVTEPEAAARRRLTEEYERAYGRLGVVADVEAGQIWRFVRDVRERDEVAVPNSSEECLHVGRISGAYEFHERPAGGCLFPSRRRVTWLRDVPYAEIPVGVRLRFGVPAVLSSLSAEAAAAARAPSPAQPFRSSPCEGEVLGAVASALRQASPDDLEDVVRAFLRATDFDGRLVRASEEAWEASGVLFGDGLADVPLRVWVRRTRRELAAESVHEMRTALAPEEHGAIVSLGGFTPPAWLEAGGLGDRPTRLIDAETLAALLLERWERLPLRVRARLGVEHVEDAALHVRFQPSRRPGGR